MKKVAILFTVLALLLVSSVSAAAKPSKPEMAGNTPESQVAPKPILGIAVANLNKARAEMMGLNRDSGVVIVQVQTGSPAATAGLKVRDIITTVNTSPVATVSEFQAAVRQAGAQVTLAVLRGKETLTLAVTLAPAGEWRLVTPPAWLPEMGGIKVKERFDRYLGEQRAFLDKDGKKHTIIATPGTVKEVKDNTLSITPNGQTDPVSFTATDKTVIRVAGGMLSSLKAGDRIIVISVDNPQEARLITSASTQGRTGWGRVGKLGPMFGRGFARPNIIPKQPTGPSAGFQKPLGRERNLRPNYGHGFARPNILPQQSAGPSWGIQRPRDAGWPGYSPFGIMSSDSVSSNNL